MNKFLQGGIVNISYISNPFSPEAKKSLIDDSSGSKTNSDSGLLSKETMRALIGNGIPVDVDVIENMIANAEKDIAMGLGSNSRTVRQLEANINRAIQSAKYLAKEEDRADKNDALGEIAVGDRGELYTLSKDGKIKSISIHDYNFDKDGSALTVNELIKHRKFNSNLAFDTTLSSTIGNNIGMSKISQYIQDIIKTVGSSTDTTEAYTDLMSYVGKESAKRPSQQQLEALQQLYLVSQQIGTDALFKRKDIVENPNVLAAFKYIESVLPRNIKYQLLGRYVANGNSINDGSEYIENIISLALSSGLDFKQEHLINYDASINKAAGTTASNKELNRNLKVLEQLIQGSLGKVDYDLVSSKNPSLGMTLHGNSIGALTNFDNNIVPKAPMSIALESSIGPLIDKTHITMGSLKINESMFDTIMYDGNDVINVWAPTDANGDIDLSGMKIFNDLLVYFDQDPALTIADKNHLLLEYGINGYINESGQFVGSGNMALFLVFTGITSDSVLNEDDDFVDKLDKESKKYELDQIERIYGYINGKNKNKSGALEFKKGLFDATTDILKAPIFMKLKPTAQIQVGTYSNRGPLVSTPTYADQIAMDLMRYDKQYSQPINIPSTALLYLNYE